MFCSQLSSIIKCEGILEIVLQRQGNSFYGNEPTIESFFRGLPDLLHRILFEFHFYFHDENPHTYETHFEEREEKNIM
jgi:hypothetical protein